MSYEGYLYFLLPEKDNQFTPQGNAILQVILEEDNKVLTGKIKDPFYLQITLTR